MGPRTGSGDFFHFLKSGKVIFHFKKGVLEDSSGNWGRLRPRQVRPQGITYRFKFWRCLTSSRYFVIFIFTEATEIYPLFEGLSRLERPKMVEP